MLKSAIISVVSLLVLATPAFATQPVQEKVDICHTGNGTNWESIEVDKDAWDEHESAHSDHEFDFLITEETPCPPVEEEPEDYCDTLEGTQAEDEDCSVEKPVIECPDGQVLQDKECVTPTATPSAPKAEAAPILPQTGGGLEFALFGLGLIVGGLGMKYLFRKR